MTTDAQMVAIIRGEPISTQVQNGMIEDLRKIGWPENNNPMTFATGANGSLTVTGYGEGANQGVNIPFTLYPTDMQPSGLTPYVSVFDEEVATSGASYLAEQGAINIADAVWNSGIFPGAGGGAAAVGVDVIGAVYGDYGGLSASFIVENSNG